MSATKSDACSRRFTIIRWRWLLHKNQNTTASSRRLTKLSGRLEPSQRRAVAADADSQRAGTRATEEYLSRLVLSIRANMSSRSMYWVRWIALCQLSCRHWKKCEQRIRWILLISLTATRVSISTDRFRFATMSIFVRCSHEFSGKCNFFKFFPKKRKNRHKRPHNFLKSPHNRGDF